MGADAGIFSEYLKPIRSVADYSADMDKQEQNALTLASARLSNQTAKQAMEDDQVARQASIKSGGDQNKLLQLLQQSGNYKAAQALQKSMFDNQKVQADTGLANAHAGNFTANTNKTAQEMQYEAAAHHAQGIAYVQTPQDITTYIDQGISKGVLPAEMRDKMLQQAHSYPSMEAWKKAATEAATPVVDQYKVAAENSRNAATNATSRANNTANIAKDYKVAGLDKNGDSTTDGGGLLSKESIINAATRYNMDGTLPPNMGRGTQGPRQISAILNEAARQAAERGDTPEAQRIAQLANKSSASALTKLQTQQTMVGAFEKNFNKNADIALGLSDKVDRTGVPILNRWINAGKRSVAGDPDLATFDASIKATVNEYAKIVGGGSGSGATAQGEIAKIEGLLSAAQNKETVVSVLNLMKRETQNRMTSFEDQKTELKNGMISIKPQTAKPENKGSDIPSGWTVKAH